MKWAFVIHRVGRLRTPTLVMFPEGEDEEVEEAEEEEDVEAAEEEAPPILAR